MPEYTVTIKYGNELCHSDTVQDVVVDGGFKEAADAAIVLLEASTAVTHVVSVSVQLKKPTLRDRFIRAKSASVVYDVKNSTSWEQEIKSLVTQLAKHMTESELRANTEALEKTN